MSELSSHRSPFLEHRTPPPPRLLSRLCCGGLPVGTALRLNFIVDAAQRLLDRRVIVAYAHAVRAQYTPLLLCPRVVVGHEDSIRGY